MKARHDHFISEFTIASIAAIGASVKPQVTVISPRGRLQKVPGRLFRDSISLLGAPGDGVLIYVCHDSVTGRKFYLLGRGKIGKALREIDRPVQIGLASHLADDGFGELFSFMRDYLLCHVCFSKT